MCWRHGPAPDRSIHDYFGGTLPRPRPAGLGRLYRHNILAIEAALKKLHSDDSVVTYFGDISDDARRDAVDDYQDEASPVRYFLSDTQTGGPGIILTAAATVIYYSNNYDLESRLQSEDRAQRIGHHHPVTYVDLICCDTVDEKIIGALRNKLSLADKVSGDAWRQWI